MTQYPGGAPDGPPPEPGPGPGPDPTNGPLTPGEERQWAVIAHLGGVLAYFPVIGILPSLLIYAIYGKRGAFVRDQSAEALNFQICVLIAAILFRILAALPLFPDLLILVWLFSLVFSVIAAVAAGRNQRYRYPITYRFIS